MRTFVARVFLYGLIVLVSLFLILPLVLTVIGSFSVYWGSESFTAGWTLDWYRQAIRDYGHTFATTFIITTATVLINSVLGTAAAYALARNRSVWLNWLEEILTLPVAVPGIAIALALVQTHAFLRVSGWLILIGHVLVTFPLMFRTVVGALRSGDFLTLQESAACLGAGPFQTFFYVILPAIRSSVFSGAIVVFLLSLGEFNITFFLYTPLTMTMPVGMYDAYATLRVEAGSAYTVIFLVLAIPLMYILHRLNQSGALSRSGGV